MDGDAPSSNLAVNEEDLSDADDVDEEEALPASSGKIIRDNNEDIKQWAIK